MKENVVNLFVSLAVGGLFYWIGSEKGEDLSGFILYSVSVLVSLFFLLISTLCFKFNNLSTGLESIKNLIDNTNSTVSETIKTKDNVTRALTEAVTDEGRIKNQNVKHLLHHGCYIVEKEDMDKAWIDLAWNIEKNYVAVNYAKPSDIYNDDKLRERWSDFGLEIQNLKPISGKVNAIQKIFIINNIEELLLDPVHEVINQHLKAKVQLYYIKIEKVNLIPALKNGLESLPSIDFSIVDDDYVFIWNLNEDRTIENGRLAFSS